MNTTSACEGRKGHMRRDFLRLCRVSLIKSWVYTPMPRHHAKPVLSKPTLLVNA